jgi:ornithine decarboxylase
MTVASTGHRTQSGVPAHWPATLSPDVLGVIDVPTPYLVTDLDTVAHRHAAFAAALPGVQTFYAMKCNPSAEILTTLAGRGAGFEIASLGELRMLQRLGIDASGVLYSNPVKPPRHIAEAYAAGLWRFSFDSPNELAKIAEHAPGSAVYVRVRVDDKDSVFPLSRKFGAEPQDAFELMMQARKLGLRPYGITFHVGSQCGSPDAWREAIRVSGRLMTELAEAGVYLEMLDIGGGFPAHYIGDAPSIQDVAEAINPALAELLPYQPELLAAEPGRHLVAEAGVMAVGIIGREVRGGQNWLFVDVGAYNGMMETIQTPTGWNYPLWTSLADHEELPQLPYVVTGPSCDSSDTMFHHAMLPATLEVGDTLYIGSTGAYTLSYASAFNGFDPPVPLYVGAATPAPGGH